ncbi:bifunctional [glutamine synthetase] adenylyltransferase/[glutamine synthetase]-adenylyl-L-tyrosine phosphorylase [Oricola cellulosilytica]|uniref:Bifunctional glutamine synthetase adenylyltransferase/adenylyl-removing enzyme n=1 Tax=Oricola cellulosilytica TaxID=1429082 RepID=A0A4R0PA64_9HYPH|nr:bifunctional [glutamine synthetase] adenylyltransferase/[glutamine synthetase]-adenylyl-L-tyrosine phosphorylase [Oricola cellulosilytica]TCD14141.1 bifunctional [glutamine synthetase] adenylyltransferase/[glutamine synthetase]-adenylyl-L-tyrosine phosphorylase [Oricola cellulosilytica]
MADDGSVWFGVPVKPLFPGSDEATAKARDTLIEAANRAQAHRLLSTVQADAPLSGFLTAVMALSPFLSHQIERQTSLLEGLYDLPVRERLEAILQSVDAMRRGDGIAEGEASLMTELRRAKAAVHLLVALGDLSGGFTVEDTTGFLSRLAEAALGASIGFLLQDAEAAGKLELADPGEPEKDTGWIVLAMGKLGAHELNYSSDIDLIVLFDPDAPGVKWPDRSMIGETMARLTRRLVRIMQERTGDGYVFRTDLRLRPDPGSTPLALPFETALVYYEARGQNWERAAMIKAKPAAGDIAAGERFLYELRPFVWRKHLDYAAIADVHSIKRQIHAHKGHGKVAIEGHNVKLGRGGIREIEFFVQTQQLIFGGRAPELRKRNTVAMLDALAAGGGISREAAETLKQAYAFLRRTEHAIQMIADEQTHKLPADPEGVEQVARLLGYDGDGNFRHDLTRTLRSVETQYAALFEHEAALGAEGNLSFTGDTPDPDTVETLSRLGYERPADIWRVVSQWHMGRYRALQSERARARLTEITPELLRVFGQGGQADESVIGFDRFISGLPSGIQLFSMLQSNPRLIELLALIMSSAPRLASIITARPLVFDGMLDPAFFSGVPDKTTQRERLDAFLGEARVYEDTLDRLRIFAAEQRFLIGVRLLTGSLEPGLAGKAFSDLADLVVDEALAAAKAELEEKHGVIPGAAVCVIALGRLGSREMTPGSDLDLIVLYDLADADAESDGAKPLDASRYFIRLTQRLTAALSAPTAEGVLYEVDFRLRPSGNKGPLATSLAAFIRYQRNDAWTWEHQTLCRARVVAGDGDLSERVEAEIRAILNEPRDLDTLKADIVAMRGRLLRDKPPAGVWDVKRTEGGMTDIDFIAQFLILAELRNGNLNGHDAAHIISSSEDGFLGPQERERLTKAFSDYTAIMQLVRLCTQKGFDPNTAPKGLTDRLCAILGFPAVETLEAHIVETGKQVAEIFRRVLGDPRSGS